MGVLGLFSTLKRRYPSVFSIHKRDITLDAIYLDANALLYPISESTKIPEEIAKRLLLVAEEYARIYQCISHIYIDGPAHMGKIRQQRMRRFLYEPTSIYMTDISNVGERSDTQTIPIERYSSDLGYNVSTLIEWSNAVFTPGTEVMKRIHQYILDHISEYTHIDIYSSYEESGEGEHKILDHIKEYSLSLNERYKVGIVGKDADLLLCGMGITPGEGWNIHPYILRHNDQVRDGGKSDGYTASDPLYIIDCISLREKILNDYQNTESIWNFIIATFLCGNDFIPAIPEMSDIRQSIPLILSLKPILFKDGDIHWEGVSSFLSDLSLSMGKSNQIYEKWIQSYSSQKDTMSIEMFEPLYYFHVSPFKVNTHGMLLSWYTTLQWIFLYYYKGMQYASISWQYPLHFSPCLNTLVSNDISDIERVYTLSTTRVNPLTPEQALCAVLPIWLHNLLPVTYRQKMKKISQYYQYRSEEHTSEIQ